MHWQSYEIHILPCNSSRTAYRMFTKFGTEENYYRLVRAPTLFFPTIGNTKVTDAQIRVYLCIYLEQFNCAF
jgi:hypothetical protein